MTYEDSYEREEKDLKLRIAKMIESIEFENTLPEAEKHKRRLIRNIHQLPRAAEVAATYGMPWVMFGCLERIVFHAEALLGPHWREEVSRQRQEWLGGDDDEMEIDGYEPAE